MVANLMNGPLDFKGAWNMFLLGERTCKLEDMEEGEHNRCYLELRGTSRPWHLAFALINYLWTFNSETKLIISNFPTIVTRLLWFFSWVRRCINMEMWSLLFFNSFPFPVKNLIVHPNIVTWRCIEGYSKAWLIHLGEGRGLDFKSVMQRINSCWNHATMFFYC